MAISHQSLTIVGNLTKDPLALKASKNGTPYTSVSVAVNTGFGERKGVTYYDVTVFGKAAESTVQYLKKGAQVAISTDDVTAGAYMNKDNEPTGTIRLTTRSLQFGSNPDANGSVPQAQSREALAVF